MERVYLDMCSLKRPFDDQRQPRIREEAAAVASIVARAESGELGLVRSPAPLVENDANPREDRRLATALWIDGAAVDVELDAGVESRAAALVELAFAPLDALHLALAERASAKWFVTCDDKLAKLAARCADRLAVVVVAPPARFERKVGRPSPNASESRERSGSSCSTTPAMATTSRSGASCSAI